MKPPRTPACLRLAPRAAQNATRAFLVASLAAVAGCPQPEPSPGPPPVLRSTDEIVAGIQSNAALLDRPLGASALTVTARFVDEKNKEHVYNLTGSLWFRRARDLRMDLRHSLTEQVMQIGSNEEDYWIWIEPELRMMRWGRYRNVGRRGSERLSIRPDQVVSALVLNGLPDARDGLIGPMRKYGKAHDILYYARRTAGGALRLDREYRVDRAPPYQVRLVLFYDEYGRLSMSAFLDRHAPAWPGGPQVPRDVSIIWHIDPGKFTMTMDAIRGVDPSAVKPGAFARPTPGAGLPPGLEVIQVDAAWDEAPPDADVLAPEIDEAAAEATPPAVPASRPHEPG